MVPRGSNRNNDDSRVRYSSYSSSLLRWPSSSCSHLTVFFFFLRRRRRVVLSLVHFKERKNRRGTQDNGRKKRDTPSVWQGNPIRFDVPDNVDVESSLTFAPPPPPDKPLFKIGWAKFKQMEDRVKNTEKDVFERGLRVSALKDKWADYLPRPPKNTLRPFACAVPERITSSELEHKVENSSGRSRAFRKVEGSEKRRERYAKRRG